MRMVALACGALAAVLCTPTSTAADGAGNYAIWGTGARSCHQFSRARADTAQLAPFRDYLMGYLTAVNALTPETYDALGGASLETTLAWLAEYCDGHKMDSFDRALGQLVVGHHEQRTRAAAGSGNGWGASSGGAR